MKTAQTNGNYNRPSRAYPEVDDIKDDLSALGSHASELARHVAAEGREQVKVAGKEVKNRLHDVEELVKSQPAKAVLLAFGAGIVASFLLSRR